MDPDRWPELVTLVVAGIEHCPRCGVAKADALLITVEYQPPVWKVKALCVKCQIVAFWHMLGPSPKPATEPECEVIPEPEWYKAVRS